MRPADIAALVAVGDPRVTPDGGMVAFTVTSVDMEANEYRSRIWIVPTDGSEEPRPFTAGEHRDAKPRWSPDGRRLAFVSHRDDDGSQLFVLPTLGGEPQRVASWPEEIEDLAWSPDGERMAFSARDREEDRYGQKKENDQPPRRITHLQFRLDSVGWTVDRPRHLFVVPADGSTEPASVTTGEYEDGGLAWSPDGAWLAFTAGRHETWDLDFGVDLFVVPATGGGEQAVERLTVTGPAYGAPSWSPDGTGIAFVRDDLRSAPRHPQIGVVDRATGQIRLLTASLDRNCSPYPPAREPLWRGDDVLFLVDDGGNVHLYRVAADGSGKPELVVGGVRQVGAFDAALGTLAYTVTTPNELPELYVQVDGEERRLTDLGRAFSETHALASPQRFTATSPDGTEVEAWLMRPVGFEEGGRYPALLNIHGGPFTQYGNRFFDEFQAQVDAGYAVVYSNPRGSSGYAEAWGRAIRGPTAEDDPGSGWGGVDYEDLMAVVDAALARSPFIDPERLGVLGGSYGGYMTSWIVGHTDRFRAACSERSCNNLLTMEHTSDIAGSFRTEMGVSHLDDPEEYRRESPITYVSEMNTPLLILHSEADLRCPVEQAEELFTALRMLGRTPEFVRFPGESHELSRSGSPKHRITRLEIVLEFFGRHLAP